MQPEPIRVVRSRPFVCLSKLAVDEDSISLRPKAREKKFSLLLNRYLMKLPRADRKLVSFGKPERQHVKVLHQRLAVNPDFQMAGELIERKVDLVLLLDSDAKAEFHRLLRIWGLRCVLLGFSNDHYHKRSRLLGTRGSTARLGRRPF
jgi:hypothetical protein